MPFCVTLKEEDRITYLNSLYKKSKIWFSLIWVIVYVVGASCADELSKLVNVEKSFTTLFLAIMVIVSIIWMKNNQLFRDFGLCKSEIKASRLLFYIPLIIIASCNLWFKLTIKYEGYILILYIVSMVLVGFLEEIIFRGFLFKAMEEKNLKSAIIVSSVTFGIGHLVNLINGSGAELIPNICQVISAIPIGFLFVILFYKTKSLWACIITHAVINSLSAFAMDISSTQQIITSAIISIVAVCYLLIIIKKNGFQK